MNLKLNFEIEKSSINLKHGDGLVLLGSCFSDAMSSHFSNAGFNVISNPFGTLFHPLAISRGVSEAITQSSSCVLQREDLFFSWLASGSLYGTSKTQLEERLAQAQKKLTAGLKSAKLLVVTFGSAWGYFHESIGIVANCHKQPQSLFDKRLVEVEKMKGFWDRAIVDLKRLNPDLEIVFTVSPVRHSKDGLIENNRSKARLIELAHQLSDVEGSYFPSYEIVIDELRDYRFFKNDLVHPSVDATKYVWDRFSEYIFSEETKDMNKKVEQINATLNHKSLYPDSMADQERLKNAKLKQEILSNAHPEIYWA